VVDLAIRAIGAPLLMPFQTAGALLVALGDRPGPGLPSLARRSLAGIGVLLLLALSRALVPPEVSDRYQGYRRQVPPVRAGSVVARGREGVQPVD
jgi:hypothetical protein